MASKPLTLKQLSRITGISSLGQLKSVLIELKKEYEDRGIEIIETESGWLMQVKDEYLDKVSHLSPYADLSEGEKRTLALVAYKEPVLQSEIIKIQGTKAYTYIRKLIQKKLIGSRKKGNFRELYLTKEFEKYFGEDKERIKEKIRQMVESL